MKATRILLPILFASILISILLTSGCIGDTKTYTAGLSPAYAPMSQMDSSTGEFTGLDTEILTWIAKDQGITIQFTPCFISGYDEAMQAGEIDLMAAMTITEERKETVDFTTPYFSAPFQIVIQKMSGITVDDVLSGKSVISCQMESAAELWLISTFGKDEFQKRVDEGKIIRRYSIESAVMDVATTAADAVVISTAVIGEMLTPHPGLQTIGSAGEIKYTAYGVKKGNPELLDKLNTGLKNLMASSDWQKMVDKYELPVRKSTYVIGVDTAMHPFAFTSETGELTGYDVDSVQWIAENQNFTVEFREMNLADCVDALNQGAIDAWYCCLPIAESMQNKITFTTPYYHSFNVVVSRTGSGNDETAFSNGNLTIGVRSGSTCSQWLGRYFFDCYNEMVIAGKINYYTRFADMKADLEAGALDAVVLPRVIASDELKDGRYTIIKRAELGYMAAAVRNGEVYLLEMLNDGIKAMNNTTLRSDLTAKYNQMKGHMVKQ